MSLDEFINGTPAIENDKEIDIKNWRYFKDVDLITTDALWVSTPTGKNSKKFTIPKREFLPKNSSEFHGLWIPEIPYQFIKRFTQENDTVWSVFGGSGTDYKVADILNRNCIATDINPTSNRILKADARDVELETKVDLALVHPPYHNIVKYSSDNGDGSNLNSIEEFVIWFNQIAKNVDKHLKDDKYVIVCCGNIFVNSEEITLGYYCVLCFQMLGYTMKSHIIKDYGETKGTDGKNYNINYYRQLKSGYNNFYGDNIFIMKKTKSKNPSIKKILDLL